MPELSLQDIDAAIDKEMASPQVNFAAHHLFLRYELIIKGMAGSVVTLHFVTSLALEGLPVS